MAGYSGTPLVRKLGIKAGQRVSFHGAPPGFIAALAPFPPSVRLVTGPRTVVDLIHFFARSRAELERRLPGLIDRLAEGGALWLSWPKRSSGVASDLSEDVLRELVLPHGWVDVKVCAVDETWSALKFLRRVRPSDKPGRPTAAEVEVSRSRTSRRHLGA